MKILRPTDVGAHCVRPLATEGRPYGVYWSVFCISQQAQAHATGMCHLRLVQIPLNANKKSTAYTVLFLLAE